MLRKRSEINRSKSLSVAQGGHLDDSQENKRLSLDINSSLSMKKINDNPRLQKSVSSLTLTNEKNNDELNNAQDRKSRIIIRNGVCKNKANRSSVNYNQSVEKYSSDDASLCSSEDYEELFDPSLIFVSMYNCYYWDSKERVRKGKILLTKNELLFKCSGMPFVRVRIFFSEINDILKIKNYKSQSDSVLAVKCSNAKTYVFYKFRVPKSLVRNNILRLMKFGDEALNNSEMLDADEQSINNYLTHFKRMGKSMAEIKGLLKPRNRNSLSLSEVKENSAELEIEEEEEINISVPKSDIIEPKPNKPRSLRLLKNSFTINNANLDTPTFSVENDEKKKHLFIKNKQKFKLESKKSDEDLNEMTISEPDTTPDVEYKKLKLSGSVKKQKEITFEYLEKEKISSAFSRKIEEQGRSKEDNSNREKAKSFVSSTTTTTKTNKNCSESNIIKYENRNVNIHHQTQLNNNNCNSRSLIFLFSMTIFTFVLMTAVNIYKLFHLERQIKDL